MDNVAALRKFDAFNLFAGPGGWSQGIAQIGLRDLGIEWNEDAAATAMANGHHRVPHDEGDVALIDPVDLLPFLRPVFGQISSPPCQGWSTLGKRSGAEDGTPILDALRRIAENPTGEQVDAEIAALRPFVKDDRNLLVLQPIRYLLYLRPAWVAWEQVPNVLALWEAHVPVLEAAGYTVATGIVSAEQFGTPQVRRRAILVARSPEFSAEHGPAALPEPTHSKYHSRTPSKLDPGLALPVTMGQALDAAHRRRGADGWHARFNEQTQHVYDPQWPWKRPATAVAGRSIVQHPGATMNRMNSVPRDIDGHWTNPLSIEAYERGGGVPGTGEHAGEVWIEPYRYGGVVKSRNDGVDLHEPWEAAVCQGFDETYVWTGNRSAQWQQVGDVVCPPVARAVVGEIAAVPWRQAEERRAA